MESIIKAELDKEKIIKLGGDLSYLLKKKCIEIDYIEKFKNVLHIMGLFIMDKNNNAFGLALPQIGICYRGYVCRFGDKIEFFINPKIILKGFKKPGIESCLSEPGVEKNVFRNESIIVKYVNIDGEYKQLKLSGLYARIVQHEQDHINGILLIDK